ncbi:hypothetical protein IscW_ISCW024486, partial [Ixodes scapularis]
GYDALSGHNGFEFSVKNSSTANPDEDKCSQKRLSGGWWFKKCNEANLNGFKLPFVLPNKPLAITWNVKSDINAYSYTYDKVEMKIRDADFGFCRGSLKF